YLQNHAPDFIPHRSNYGQNTFLMTFVWWPEETSPVFVLGTTKLFRPHCGEIDVEVLAAAADPPRADDRRPGAGGGTGGDQQQHSVRAFHRPGEAGRRPPNDRRPERGDGRRQQRQRYRFEG